MKKNYSKPSCITVPIRGERLLGDISVNNKGIDRSHAGLSRGHHGYYDEEEDDTY